MSYARYHEFAAAYSRAVTFASNTWQNPDPAVRAAGLVNAELAVRQLDVRNREFANRAALLGPELGGTVLGAAQTARPDVAAA